MIVAHALKHFSLTQSSKRRIEFLEVLSISRDSSSEYFNLSLFIITIGANQVKALYYNLPKRLILK